MLQLITDRMQSDVDRISTILKTPKALRTPQQQEELDSAASKGSYNYTDLNRVTEAMEYLDDTLRSYGYVTGYQRLEVPHDTTGGGSLLPDGYTELSYIESSGTQYVNTDFTPNQDTRVICKAVVPVSNVTNWLFGARTSNAANMYSFLGARAGNYRTDYGTITSAFPVNLNTTEPIVIDKNKNNTTIDGENLSQIATQTFSAPVPLALFAVNTNGAISYGSCRIYYFQIYDNGTLVRDFVPCISDSGAIGLYDTVEEQFYANAGTGVFTAGDVVDMPITGDESDTEYDAYTWYESDIPTESLMEAYLANVEALRSTLDVLESTPQTPESMEALTWVEANNIEQILLDVHKLINQVVESFSRSNSYTFWSGNRPLPSADSYLGRTWEKLDAMNTTWRNWQVANWYLLLYGNLKAEGDVV